MILNKYKVVKCFNLSIVLLKMNRYICTIYKISIIIVKEYLIMTILL